MPNSVPGDIANGLRKAQSVSLEEPNSAAARFGPNADGSLLGQQHPSIFGQFGSSNPTYQASSRAYGAAPSGVGGTPQGLARPIQQSGVNPQLFAMLQQAMSRNQSNASSDEDEAPTEYGY